MTKESGMTGSTGLIRPPTAAQLITYALTTGVTSHSPVSGLTGHPSPTRLTSQTTSYWSLLST